MTDNHDMAYSLKNVLGQAPDKIKAGLLLIGTAVVVTATGADSAAVLATWAVAIERLLEWFYVAPVIKENTKAQLQELQDAVDANK